MYEARKRAIVQLAWHYQEASPYLFTNGEREPDEFATKIGASFTIEIPPTIQEEFFEWVINDEELPLFREVCRMIDDNMEACSHLTDMDLYRAAAKNIRAAAN